MRCVSVAWAAWAAWVSGISKIVMTAWMNYATKPAAVANYV